MEWMILPLRRYFDFRGRSRRKEYWMFFLFTILVTMVLTLFDILLGLGGSASSDTTVSGTGIAASGVASGGILANLFSLAILIPSLAVGVRRLHDTDRSGWFILLPLVPYVIGIAIMVSGSLVAGGIVVLGGVACAIYLLVLFCTNGTPGPNRFGPDPKGATDDLEVFS